MLNSNKIKSSCFRTAFIIVKITIVTLILICAAARYQKRYK